jgi:hypothetical protein
MKTYVQELLDELEAAGLIVKNGQMRFNSRGVLAPAYEVAPEYVNDLGAAEKVLKAMSEFELVEKTGEKANRKGD